MARFWKCVRIAWMHSVLLAGWWLLWPSQTRAAWLPVGCYMTCYMT